MCIRDRQKGKDFQCESCVYKTKSVTLLKQHITNYHQNKIINSKRIYCNKCDKKFNKKSTFETHISKVQIENDNIQELQVISGTFNAEYGKALTGVVNMVTKDGGNNFDGSFHSYAGDYNSSDDTYQDLNNFKRYCRGYW